MAKENNRKQLGVLVDAGLLKQLKLEAVENDMSLADYIRFILENRSNILHNILHNETNKKGD